MTHELVLYAYCGMPQYLAEGSLEECREAAARQIKEHRKSERGVAILEPGKEWEMLEMDGGMSMIADDEGVLKLKSVED